MKKRYQVLIAGLILALVVSAGIGGAWAYFTAQASAAGALTIHFGSDTTITEDPPEDWTKSVVITNDEDSYSDVYVRARAFIGSEYTATPQNANGWTRQGEWSYYAEPLAPGGSTQTLLIDIAGVDPAAEAEGEFVNVAVVYECIEVQYDAEGEPIDWTEEDWERPLVDSLREEAE